MIATYLSKKVFSLFCGCILFCGIPLISGANGDEVKVKNDTEKTVKVLWMSNTEDDFVLEEEMILPGEISRGHVFHPNAIEYGKQLTLYPDSQDEKQYAYKVLSKENRTILASEVIGEGTFHDPSQDPWTKMIDDILSGEWQTRQDEEYERMREGRRDLTKP